MTDEQDIERRLRRAIQDEYLATRALNDGLPAVITVDADAKYRALEEDLEQAREQRLQAQQELWAYRQRQ